MTVSSNYHLGREVLKNFFRASSQQKAFWYLAVLPTNYHHMDNRVSVHFPSLSQLMNIEEDTLRKVLMECKLVQKNSKASGT
jgi:hypothetical protein